MSPRPDSLALVPDPDSKTAACVNDVLDTYTAAMKSNRNEKKAFDEAVRVWRGYNPNASPEQGPPAVATIICHKSTGLAIVGTAMPARVVLAHDDTEFLDRASAALTAAGLQVASCSGSMAALSALQAAKSVDLLITRVNFIPGTPNGVALARMARRERHGIKVLFIAREEMRGFADGLGEFLPAPVGIPDLLDTVHRLLDPSPRG
jgi:CheY-like chemotaxis protein